MKKEVNSIGENLVEGLWIVDKQEIRNGIYY